MSMNLFVVLALTTAAFLLLQFLLLPIAIRRMESDRSRKTISRAALVSILGYLRMVALIATLTGAISIAVILIAMLAGRGLSVTELNEATVRFRSWRQDIRGFGEGWGYIVGVMLILATMIFVRRRAKVRVTAAFQKLMQLELDRVLKEVNAGTLEPLPPTDEMKKVQTALGELQKTVSDLLGSGKLTKAQADALVAEAGKQAERLQRHYVSLDIDRRVRKSLDPDAVKLPAPRNRWEKLQVLLMSRGLFGSLNGGTRALVLASLLLLVPSYLGVMSPATGESLGTQIDRLTQLAVSMDIAQADAVAEQVRQERQQAEQQSPQSNPAPLTAQDRSTIRQLASTLRQKAAQAETWSEPREEFRRSYSPKAAGEAELRQQVAKDEVLKAAAAAEPDRWDNYRTVVDGDRLSPDEKPVVDAVAREVATASESDSVARAAADLEDVASRHPDFLGRVREWGRSFQEPLGRPDLVDALANHLFHSFTDVGPNGLRDLAGFDLPLSSKAAGRYESAVRDHFVADVLRGKPVAQGLAEVGRPAAERRVVAGVELAEMKQVYRTVGEKLDPVGSIAQKYHDDLPGIEIKPTPEAAKRQAAVADALSRYEQQLKSAAGEVPYDRMVSATESAAEFRDYFPAQRFRPPDASAQPAAQRFRPPDPSAPIPDIGPRPPPPGIGPTVRQEVLMDLARAAPSAEAEGIGEMLLSGLSQARSFEALSGFSRVGGVLIGNLPKAATTAPGFEVRDLRWDVVDDNHIRLVVTDSNGTEYRSIPHRKELVYRALVYAADGRPLTATMTTARPLPDLKILLHPALVDTPLGYRAIEIDRFVDVYTGSEGGGKLSADRAAASERVYAHLALYQYARACRIQAALSDFPLPQVQSEFAAGAELEKQQSRELALQALKDPDALTDPRRSPLTAKSEFFDPDLVKTLSEAANHCAGDLAKFDSLTRDASTQAIAPEFQSWMRQFKSALAREDGTTLKFLLSQLKERQPYFQQVTADAPEFVIWSGVREKDFQAAPGDLLMVAGAAPARPFRFMLQVAFTSPPMFGPKAGSKDYSDDQPWEFPELAEAIDQRVNGVFDADPTGRDAGIMHDMAEFALLQRLFRAGFAGRLGESFPMEKLVALTRVVAPAGHPSTGPSVTACRTPRWNTHPGELEARAFSLLSGALPLLSVQPDTGSVAPEAGAAGTGASAADSSPPWLGQAKGRIHDLTDLLNDEMKHRDSFYQAEKDMLSAHDKGSPQWRIKWDAQFADGQHWQVDWENRWRQAYQSSPSLAELAQSAQPKTAKDDDSGATSEAPGGTDKPARVLAYLADKVAEFSTAIEVRRARDVDVDEKQAIEEQEGLSHVPELK